MHSPKQTRPTKNLEDKPRPVDENAGAAASPELFIGLIGAVGTDTHHVTGCLREALAKVGYRMEEIHAIELLAKFRGWEAAPAATATTATAACRPEPLDTYYHALMNAGNRFRATTGSNAAMAMLAINAVRERRAACEHSCALLPRTAYVIRSLKTPAEVAALREVYGKSFIALAAYAPKSARRRFLLEQMAASRTGDLTGIDLGGLVDSLLNRDEAEPEEPFGQNIAATFPLADFFVEIAPGQGTLGRSLSRIVELVFGNLFHAPTREEYGMFHAVSAGVRSSSLARQVGASICTPDGELIALGCNDVPKAGGGLYWEGDEGDSRDHLRGYDSNDQMKTLFFRDILARLQKSGWLDSSLSGLDETQLLEHAMRPGSLLRQAELMKVIEYGRSVHAEMAALMDAAKRGIAVEGCTLYTTTFPCHNCAKHIVASGLKRVVYVEPYPKSFTKKLYSDSVWIEGEGDPLMPAKAVRFEPFVGISFRQYFSLFSVNGIERKVNGTLTPWMAETAVPRYGEHPSAYLARETLALGQFRKLIEEAPLEPVKASFWDVFGD